MPHIVIDQNSVEFLGSPRTLLGVCGFCHDGIIWQGMGYAWQTWPHLAYPQNKGIVAGDSAASCQVLCCCYSHSASTCAKVWSDPAPGFLSWLDFAFSHDFIMWFLFCTAHTAEHSEYLTVINDKETEKLTVVRDVCTFYHFSYILASFTGDKSEEKGNHVTCSRNLN